jgi:hypothetical protein
LAGPSRDTEPNYDAAAEACRAKGKPLAGGANACRCLSLLAGREGPAGKAKPANRTRENRPSGITTGAWVNVANGRTRNPLRNRKSGCGHSRPKGCARLSSIQTSYGSDRRKGPIDNLGWNQVSVSRESALQRFGRLFSEDGLQPIRISRERTVPLGVWFVWAMRTG